MNIERAKSNKRNENADFVEAFARGIDVIKAFGPTALEMTVSEAASRTGLARPTARRILITLEQLGYARSTKGAFTLTTKTLELGTAYISALGIWEVARPHLLELVGRTGESSSMSQLDGSDIVYMARVAVPKIIALSVTIGTRFPAVATSMGRVLLSSLSSDELDAALARPSASGVIPRVTLSRKELARSLDEIRERGWAMSDEMLSAGVRSVAAPVRDRTGRIAAAVNVTVHAAETPIDLLVGEHLPRLLETAAAITADWERLKLLPMETVEKRPSRASTSGA